VGGGVCVCGGLWGWVGGGGKGGWEGDRRLVSHGFDLVVYRFLVC